MMSSWTFTLPTDPVGGMEGLAYLKRGIEPPAIAHYDRPATLGPAMCVPTRMRWFHKLYANRHGYFWLPCPKCLRPFGGHEVSGHMDLGGGRAQMTCTYCAIEERASNQEGS